jgi:AbrB family looped-hinge helix DNA binding protein
MSVPRSKLDPQGRTYIPAGIRKELGIGPGTVLEWHHDGNDIVLRKKGRYSSDDIHRALFPTRPRTRSLEELKEGIADYVRDKHGRRDT